ncbi:6-phosphogluconolactonase [Aliikangiella marina]|uniref:6-phosphogluconolactonase n=1 Tax=Aliikangiella marina TaxID=1712262 RepID=A0A545TCW4_9GAMM|nr:6-phosphogluconolactonase [Aliikangiella marina]TQV75063.1 6-phosphogluconolactonase [Aliikangiella marina]
MIKEIQCDSRDELFTNVANKCASRLTRGVEKQGRASFVVPGGTTPAPMFERLSKMSLDWHNILVAPSDERWIPVDHQASNQKLVEENLLINQASKARVMPLKNDAETPMAGEAIAEKNISELEQPFDVTLVGMGNDGHFASLFPGTPQIAEALDPETTKKCIGIDATGCPVAGEFTQRISLTLSAILNSKLIIVLITGKEKLQVVQRAKAKLAPFDLPISALFHQNQTPVEVYWAE